ncbi:anti-sigma factor family protein [Nonomuraea sp. NPDC052265]|uniref:anti-sigma factor family protein n=1 Tax=Nonomuraea sp. NPDC052265 TaxID=3364374 RepID=UPI0037C879D2
MKRFTCDELVELITAYLDDALDQPERERFEAHVASCADCGRQLGRFRETVRALRESTPERKLSDGTRDRLMSAFRARRHRG